MNSCIRCVRPLASASVLLAMCVVVNAHAQKNPNAVFSTSWSNTAPRINWSFKHVVSPALRSKLQSGLPQTVMIQTAAFHGQSDKPIAAAAQLCRVVYDLWEGTYRLEVHTYGQQYAQATTSLDTVIHRCFTLQNFMVGTPANYAPLKTKAVRFRGTVEFNPLSDQSMERIRRWLARSGSTGRSEGDAFFGSFVSLFVSRRIGAAEFAASFQSPFTTVQ